MNARPGYWDVEQCAWVGAEPTNVVPPAPASPEATAETAVPTPRTGAEVPAPSAPAAAESTAG